MAAWAVDREFVSIYLVPLASLWCLWNAFGFPWRDFRLHLAPFGVHLAPFGIHLVPFGLPLGVHLGGFGVPLGLLGPLGGSLGCLGAYSRFLSKKGLQFRADGSQVRSLPSKNDLPELIPGLSGLSGSPGSGRNATWPAAPNPPSLAPGARMT